MATLGAQVTPTGIIAPDLADILQQMKILFWSIYGSDSVLDDSSQDLQFLTVLAQEIYDAGQVAIFTYNQYSPATAQGTGLDSVVKINGITRKVATNSQAVVTVGGTVGTIISNGVVGDNLNLGTRWNLPASVVIPIAGTIDVTATCTEQGATPAAAGTLTAILTPTRGWQTVTNALSATQGQPVESDAALRQRQSVSTALPAQSILSGIYGVVANLAGVNRLQVYVNDTNAADGNGIPAHSFSVVAEGGDVDAIANAIAIKKAPGSGTFGTTTRVVIDSHGIANTINFFAATEVPLSIAITIQSQAGFVSTTGDAIKQALVGFVNGLSIGEDSFLARLYTPANLTGTGLGSTFVVTVLQQAKKPAVPAAADIIIAFNEAASLTLADIALTVL